MNFLRCSSLGIVWSVWDSIGGWLFTDATTNEASCQDSLLDPGSEMTVHQISEKDVELWLVDNHGWFEDFVLKHAKRDLIQRWLDNHSETSGKIPAVPNSILSPTPKKTKNHSVFFGGIVSTSSNAVVVSSPSPVLSTPSSSSFSTVSSSSRKTEHSDSGEKSESTSSDEGIVPPARQRSGSRQYLRQDFARARSKAVFSTWAGATDADEDRQGQLDIGPTSPSDLSGSEPGNFNGRRRLRRASTVPPPQLHVTALSQLLESKIPRLPHRPSITKEAKLKLRSANEREFFLALVKDISNDLDLDSLREKITSNVTLLVDADNGSIFLKEGPQSNFVSKPTCSTACSSPVFKFPPHIENLIPRGSSYDDESSKQEPLVVICGEGIVGRTAESGKGLRVESCKKGSPQYKEVESLVSVQPESILCQPIKNSEDDVIGVALVINTAGGKCFTAEDEKLLETYLTFCGIGISNAELFDTSMKEYDRNKKLLEVAHDLFEEQTCLESVVQKTMQRAQSLLHCERCSVMLVKDPNAEEVTINKVFHLSGSLQNGNSSPSFSSCDPKPPNGIIEYVVNTGERVNITDPMNDPRIDKENDEESNFETKSMLCMPIRNNKFEIIGVAQVLNREDGFPFDENDEQLFEAFTIFCGLGINNTIMYNKVSKAMALQKVALDVLSYHASATQQEVEQLKAARLPDIKKLRLTRYDFDDFSLQSDEMLRAALKMYIHLGLLETFKISSHVMCRWLLTVRKNYRPVAYHNFRHAFNVQQVMFAVLENTGIRKYLSTLEQLALMVGCLCHDLDHRGTNNAFQEKSQSALVQLYGSKATMEYHHFNHAVMILNSEGHNIFANLSSEQYSDVMNVLKRSIISTDLALHLKVRDQFFDLVKTDKFSWHQEEHKDLMKGILMTACDLAASTKPWRIQQKIAELVTSEFFDQGDKERMELKIEPTSMYDRRRKDELPEMQLGFIDGVCLPIYQGLAKIMPNTRPMLLGVKANRQKWNELNEQRKRKKAPFK